MYHLYQLPQGKILIGISNKNLSIGTLYLEPRKALDKHNRPVKEQLIQVFGTCVMKLFDGENILKEITLRENEVLTILANQFHQHTNPTGALSVTMWRFDGDITDVIEKIRQTNEEIPLSN